MHFKFVFMILYKQVIPSQMLVVTISMQDKCCKMIRVTACLFGCLVSLITPTLSVSSATTPWLKQQTCFLFSVHSKVAEQVWQVWQPVDHAMF